MKNLKQQIDKSNCTNKYKSTFLIPTEFRASNGSTVYISKEFHQRISLIVFMIGEKMNISDYLHNLLKDHFEVYEEEIIALYNANQKTVF